MSLKITALALTLLSFSFAFSAQAEEFDNIKLKFMTTYNEPGGTVFRTSTGNLGLERDYSRCRIIFYSDAIDATVPCKADDDSVKISTAALKKVLCSKKAKACKVTADSEEVAITLVK